MPVVSYSDKIPEDYMASESDLPNLIVTKDYSEELGGYLIVEGTVDKETNQVKIFSIDVVKAPNSAKVKMSYDYDMDTKDCGEAKSIKECMRCCTDKPTTEGVVLCTGYCIIDFIKVQG